MILNEATFIKLDKSAPVDKNKTYDFDGVPSLSRLTRLEKEITQDIVSIATGGLVYVRDQNERNRKGLCEVIPEVDSTGISRGKLGSFALNCKSRKFDTEQYFAFGLADIMAREKYLLIKKHPNGDKWVPDNARYNAIQKLLDRMVELAAECDTATREYRDAQGYDRPRNVRQTIEQRFEQEVANDVVYLGQNELHHSLVWLATHILTISANLNSKLLPIFKKYFGDVKQSVTIVDAAKRTKNGAPAKYSWSFQASIKDPESMPNSLKKYLNEKGTAITDTGFISKLVREYGFNFGKNNSNQTLKNLADILNDPDIASLVKTNENLKEGIDKMAAKITKAELKNMIKEALREELSKSMLKEHHYPEREDWFCDSCYDRLKANDLIEATRIDRTAESSSVCRLSIEQIRRLRVHGDEFVLVAEPDGFYEGESFFVLDGHNWYGGVGYEELAGYPGSTFTSFASAVDAAVACYSEDNSREVTIASITATGDYTPILMILTGRYGKFTMYFYDSVSHEPKLASRYELVI
jgi:hypothetical protein